MILVLTNADTEILALRSVIEALPDGFCAVRAANPNQLGERVPDLDGVAVVVVRLLGGRQAWPGPFDDLRRQCRSRGIPLLAFGGEAAADAELTALSTVASSTVAQAFEYLVHGGLANTEQFLRFIADTVLMEGFGFDPPAEVPATGIWRRPAAGETGPLVAVIFYRAHLIAGNTRFVDDLCDAIEDRGGRALAVWCYSLRPDAGGRVAARALLAADEYGPPDAIVTTVLAAGGAGQDDADWDAGALAGFGVPVVQATPATSPAQTWLASTAGLSPLDVAMSVAIPEFDGRIIAGAFSFKEEVDDGDTLGAAVTAYRTRPDRVRRVAGLAVRLAQLRHVPEPQRRVAIVLSAYPTKRSRVGNAVALDTPASVIGLLHALRGAGYRVDRIPADGDELMAELIDTFSYEREALTSAQMARAAGRWPAAAYRDWFETLPATLKASVAEAWGPPPGSIYTDPAGGDLVFAGLDLGHVIVAVQPPRGFGERPHRRLPLARPGPDPPLPGFLPMAGPGMGRARSHPRWQARDPGVAPRQGRRAVGGLRPRRRARRPAARLPLRRQRPRRGHPSQTPGPRSHRRPPCCADDQGGDLRRHRPAGGPARHLRRGCVARPLQAARHQEPGVGAPRRRRVASGPRRRGAPCGRRVRRTGPSC